MSEGRAVGPGDEDRGGTETSAGIVVTDSSVETPRNGDNPRIAAFIWGGKVKPAPTLPYGRWRGAA